MSSLAPHREANKLFAKGCAPSVHVWRDWVVRGVIRGKVIDDKPFIDLNHFAANDIFKPDVSPSKHRDTVLRLITKS